MPRLRNDQLKQLLWERGDLSWKLRDYQNKLDEAYNNRSGQRNFVANCSRRFGKSFWACTKAIEAALTCQNQLPRIKMATATVKNLEEFILPAFNIIFDDCPEHIWAGWKDGYLRSKKKFVFPNGAEIQLVGLDKDPDGGRGNYVDLYIIDEAGFVSRLEYLFSSVISPMMLGRDGASMIMLSTPSSTPAHPFQDFCRRAQDGGYYAEFTIFENTSISEEERERIRVEDCLTESDWLREYLCKHVVDETLAITPEFKQKHVAEVSRPEWFEYADRYECMDLGVKVDLTAILFAWYDIENQRLVVEDEADITGPEMTTDLLKGLIINKERQLWPNMPKPYKRVSDSDNPLLLQDLNRLHGIQFLATRKTELHKMVNKVRIMLKSDRIVINPRCKKLIGCLETGIWNAQRTKFERSNTLGHFDHLAALIYLAHNLDEFHDPIPAEFRKWGKTTPEFVVLRPKRKSAQEKLRKLFR